jgi:hypothetical protein
MTAMRGTIKNGEEMQFTIGTPWRKGSREAGKDGTGRE